MIKTFKGLLADGGQDRIKLSTIQGKVGYRIVKFEAMPAGATTGFGYESFLQVWTSKQSSVPSDGTPDFSNPEVLACIYYSQSASGGTNPEDMTVVFDNEVVNQDIYITHSNSDGSAALNYYLELEAIPLTDLAAEFTTLKDLRGYINMNPWR